MFLGGYSECRFISFFFQPIRVVSEVLIIFLQVKTYFSVGGHLDLYRDHCLSFECQEKWCFLGGGSHHSSVVPQDTRQLLMLEALWVLKSLLDDVQLCPAGDLHLTFSLRVCRGREVISHFELWTKFSEPDIVELLTVVIDEYPRYPNSAHNWFPCEVPDILLSDIS